MYSKGVLFCLLITYEIEHLQDNRSPYVKSRTMCIAIVWRIRDYATEHKNGFFITNCLFLFESFSNLAVIGIVIDKVFLKIY